MLDRFSWRSYDLRSILPVDWQDQILATARRAVSKTIHPVSVTSREGNPDLEITLLSVHGDVIREQLPWLHNLYKGHLRDLVQLAFSEPVFAAINDIIGAVIHVQRGTDMRYESHIDTVPTVGLLYVTDHPKGSGGELVVANSPSANSVAEIEADCSIVYPAAGNFVFFDGRRFPHYVRPLVKPDDVRVVVAMDFFTPSCSEEARPDDLNAHLYGSADNSN